MNHLDTIKELQNRIGDHGKTIMDGINALLAVAVPSGSATLVTFQQTSSFSSPYTMNVLVKYDRNTGLKRIEYYVYDGNVSLAEGMYDEEEGRTTFGLVTTSVNYLIALSLFMGDIANAYAAELTVMPTPNYVYAPVGLDEMQNEEEQ